MKHEKLFLVPNVTNVKPNEGLSISSDHSTKWHGSTGTILLKIYLTLFKINQLQSVFTVIGCKDLDSNEISFVCTKINYFYSVNKNN